MRRQILVWGFAFAMPMLTWGVAAYAAGEIASEPAEAATVTVDGVAAIRDGDVPAAKEAAIENALRQAVEQACGVHLTSESQVRNFELVGDAVLARSRGFVTSYQVLGEYEQEGTYLVTVRAQVQLSSIDGYLSYSTMVADFTEIDERTGKTLADIFTTAFAASPRYVVLERTPLRLATVAAIVPGIDVFGEDAAKRAASQLGARLLIVGTYAYRGGDATLCARMIDLATAKVVTNGTAIITGRDRDLHQLVRDLADRLHQGLTGMRLRGMEATGGGRTPEERLYALESLDPTNMLAGSTAEYKVRLTTDRGDTPTYHAGETMTLKVQVDRDCYVTIYSIDSGGRVTLLLPNGFSADNRLKPGKTYLIPPPDADWELRVKGEPGTEYIQAIGTLGPLELCKPEAFAKSPFPTLSDDAGEFVSKGVAPALTARAKDEWATALVKFYLRPAEEPLEVGG